MTRNIAETLMQTQNCDSNLTMKKSHVALDDTLEHIF